MLVKYSREMYFWVTDILTPSLNGYIDKSIYLYTFALKYEMFLTISKGYPFPYHHIYLQDKCISIYLYISIPTNNTHHQSCQFPEPRSPNPSPAVRPVRPLQRDDHELRSQKRHDQRPSSANILVHLHVVLLDVLRLQAQFESFVHWDFHFWVRVWTICEGETAGQ